MTRERTPTLCQFQRAAADFISSSSANIICMPVQMRMPSIYLCIAGVIGEIEVLSSASICIVLAIRRTMNYDD